VVSEQDEPGIGDRVLVPWGLDEVEGEIVEVYSTGLGPRATVRLVGEPDGPTVVVPLDSLVAVTAHREEPRAAAASAREYERLVGAALRRAAAEFNLVGPHSGVPDTGVDFELSLGKRHLLVEVKHYRGTARVSTDTVLTITGLAKGDAAVLLVANVPLAPSALRRLKQLAQGRTRVGFAQWRGTEDDRELRDAFGRLLLN